MSATVMFTASTRSSNGCCAPAKEVRNSNPSAIVRRPKPRKWRFIFMSLPDHNFHFGAGVLAGFIRGGRHAHTLEQVIPHAQGVRDNGERRIHRRAGWKETSVNHVEIIDIVSFAVDVKRRSLGIVTKADGTVLMSDPGERNALTHIQIAREHSLVALVTVN